MIQKLKVVKLSPSPETIRAARESAGLTQTEAAAVIYSTLRAWQGWEASVGSPAHRRMNPAMFELFRMKVAQNG